MEVSRASHTHQAPHMGLPQSEPLASAMKVKQAPMGEAARAIRSPNGWRQMRALALASAMQV